MHSHGLEFLIEASDQLILPRTMINMDAMKTLPEEMVFYRL